MYFNSDTLLYLDGKFQKAEASKVNLYMQTLHYGYGVFEGIRAYKTDEGVAVFKGSEHYERLKKSAESIGLPYKFNNDEVLKATYELLEKNNLHDAYIRPLVFSDPNMSLTFPEESHLMICAWKWGAYLGDKLLRIKISSYCHPHPRSIVVEAKACGHYVNSILATGEAKKEGFDEALLLDMDGYLAEGPGANLFFEKDGKLYTPQTGNILSGITRKTVMELCEDLGVGCNEGKYLPEDLLSADSAFYCGTAAEIVGFDSVNDYKFPLAWSESLGKKLHNAYKKLVLNQKMTADAL